MVDPVSLAALGGAALSEGIKFLYGQATDILRRRRECKDAEAAGRQPGSEAIPIEDRAGVLEGTLRPIDVDDRALEDLADLMTERWTRLSGYAQGIQTPDPNDRRLLADVEALRLAIESVIGQRITFRGEAREPSGTPVAIGTVTARDIRGRVTGLEADEIADGEGRGHVHAETIERDADVTGLRIGRLGRPPKP